jgi:hypothetical protein
MKIVRSAIDFLPRKNRGPPRHFWPETNSASKRRHSRIPNLQSRFTSFGLRKFCNIFSGLRYASGEIFVGIHSWLSQLFRFYLSSLVVLLPRASFLFRRRNIFLIVPRCAPRIFEGAACTPLMLKMQNAHIPIFMQLFSATGEISRVTTGERHANLLLDTLYYESFIHRNNFEFFDHSPRYCLVPRSYPVL